MYLRLMLDYGVRKSCVLLLILAHFIQDFGILRERHEHARGRNLADCRRICGSPRKSVGLIKEMWQKYST